MNKGSLRLLLKMYFGFKSVLLVDYLKIVLLGLLADKVSKWRCNLNFVFGGTGTYGVDDDEST